jgi:hypothetical protein
LPVSTAPLPAPAVTTSAAPSVSAFRRSLAMAQDAGASAHVPQPVPPMASSSGAFHLTSNYLPAGFGASAATQGGMSTVVAGLAPPPRPPTSAPIAKPTARSLSAPYMPVTGQGAPIPSPSISTGANASRPEESKASSLALALETFDYIFQDDETDEGSTRPNIAAAPAPVVAKPKPAPLAYSFAGNHGSVNSHSFGNPYAYRPRTAVGTTTPSPGGANSTSSGTATLTPTFSMAPSHDQRRNIHSAGGRPGSSGGLVSGGMSHTIR